MWQGFLLSADFPGSLHNPHFPLQLNAKAASNRLHNFSGEGNKLRTRAATVVDQYKGLFVMDADLTAPVAFPATGLDEPCRRDFYMLPVNGKGGNFGVGLANGLKMSHVHLRIFEKRTCVANDRRIGKLALANGNDSFAHLARADGAFHICQGLFQGCITEVNLRNERKAKYHPCNEEFARALSLEKAVPVTEGAIPEVKPADLERVEVKCFEVFEGIFDF